MSLSTSIRPKSDDFGYDRRPQLEDLAKHLRRVRITLQVERVTL